MLHAQVFKSPTLTGREHYSCQTYYEASRSPKYALNYHESYIMSLPDCHIDGEVESGGLRAMNISSGSKSAEFK